ncbi:hypothetical protein [Oceaniradius stylonematis]|uniref:hypothetical protein n=1 Tax=Oceaniradius stylonematis TaxID=2184161 RepID=UPI003B5AED30
MTGHVYSPATLGFFIAARIAARRTLHGETPRAARRAVSAIVRRDAGVSHQAFTRAHRGELVNPALRVRIWGALGHVPADDGIELTPDGGQRVFRSSPAASPSAGGLRPEGADARSRLPAAPGTEGDDS